MNLDTEISHLIELMPASGRMMTKIVSQPQQAKVIETSLPMPWQQGTRPILINFDLWRNLSRPQRDLLLLRSVSGLIGVKWFKPNIYQAIAAAGLLGLVIEISQADAVGMMVAGGLTAIATNQIWRSNRSLQKELDADESAISVAIRRGYTETEAARHLLSALETVAQIENRPLNFTELLRSQNLRVIGNLSPVVVPSNLRTEK
ncbi:DUF3318 domain-containing protein [Chroococcus sp. FPU101]|uniref:DUF3318 domain-containing protein n=1 Tax=Chroococcus sp. FPU101 TaxID=1974212 RepID=UPI001A9047E9|nr:DUF3318 domain-containing protein [Chroococcus sp. FPU101]GFE67987.1 hypothetical protein CFPU101_05970 [Chroococcus sp. FPU101]